MKHKREDLFVEYITLQHILGNYQETLPLIQNRIFHPWEGGGGKITQQYTTSHIGLALAEMDN